MLIGICGGICSGKKTVARYLVEHHGFQQLYLEPAGKHEHGSAQEDVQQQRQRQIESSGPASAISAFPYPPTPEQDALPGALLASALTASGTGSRGRAIGSGENGADAAASDTSWTLRRRAPAVHQTTCTFGSPEALLDYVTLRWQRRFVTTDMPTEAVLDVFVRRPFFLLLSVDAPLTVRWRRFRQRARQAGRVGGEGGKEGGEGKDGEEGGDDGDGHGHGHGHGHGDGGRDGRGDMTLEDFALRSDAHLYDAHGGLQPLIARATVRLVNTSSSLAHLYATLGKLDLANPDRLRPGWDTYFMALASLAAQRSNCMKRR
ncbi:hypothetical protein E4U42_007822, partial [Claviceps africana]